MPKAAVIPQNYELINGFLLSRSVMDCTPATLKDYKLRLNQFNRYLFANSPGLPLVQVERRHIEAYLMDIKGKGRASWTLRTQYRCLSAFYRWMIEEQFIDNSPLFHMRLPKVPKVGKAFLTETQRDRLLSFCPLSTFVGSRTAAMIWLLWTTGMRLSELTGLQISDLDNQGNKIRVFGKGRKERYVPYSKEAKKAVWRYTAYRADTLPQLWLTEERKPMKSAGVQEAFDRIYKRADIHVKDICHIFRRTWAMRQLKAGVPIRYVQIIGGWENLSTMETYVRAMQTEEALDDSKVKWV